MSAFNKRFQGMLKGRKYSELNSDMKDILELLGQQFQVANMLKALLKKVDSMQEEMGNVNKWKNSKNQKNMQ